MPTPIRTIFRRPGPLLACGAAAALLAGLMPACNIVGGAFYAVHGPEKIPAMYELDRAKKTVVLIDDRGPVVNSRVNRVRIGTTAERALLDAGKMEQVISSQDLLAIAEREKGSKPMGLVELGEAVGAEVVISAMMISFSLTPDGQSYQPSAQVSVKVMDVTGKKRLWPKDPQESYLLVINVPQKQGTPPKSLPEVEAAYGALAERVGLSLANLFIKHEARTPDGRIDQ